MDGCPGNLSIPDLGGLYDQSAQFSEEEEQHTESVTKQLENYQMQITDLVAWKDQQELSARQEYQRKAAIKQEIAERFNVEN